MRVSLFCRFSFFFHIMEGIRYEFARFSVVVVGLPSLLRSLSWDVSTKRSAQIVLCIVLVESALTALLPRYQSLNACKYKHLQVEIALQFRSSPPGMQNLGWSHHFSHSIIAGHLICSSLSACLIVDGLRASPLSNTWSLLVSAKPAAYLGSVSSCDSIMTVYEPPASHQFK